MRSLIGHRCRVCQGLRVRSLAEPRSSGSGRVQAIHSRVSASPRSLAAWSGVSVGLGTLGVRFTRAQPQWTCTRFMSAPVLISRPPLSRWDGAAWLPDRAPDADTHAVDVLADLRHWRLRVSNHPVHEANPLGDSPDSGCP